MRVIHLISGGDVGGAKTHVLSLLQGLNQAHRVLLVCFMEGPFAQEAREMGIPTQVLPGWNIPRIICRLEELIRTGALPDHPLPRLPGQSHGVSAEKAGPGAGGHHDPQ